MTSIDTTNDHTENQAKRDAFAQKFMTVVKQNGIHHSMKYDKERFSVIIDTPSVCLTQNLRNAFKEYCAVYGKTRRRILMDYVLGLKDAVNTNKLVTAPFNEIRKRLRPLVRSRILTDNERYEFKGDDPSQFKPTPRQLFSGDANILLGFDLGRSIMEVNQSMLDQWGVSFANAIDIAMMNLATMSRSRFKEIKPGLFAGEWNDYYDSSRLLLPKLFAECHHVADPIIMIPTSGSIYITDKMNRRAQLDMLYLVKNEVSTSKKIVSVQMYQFVSGRPIEYEPTDSQVLYKLDEIRKPLLENYARQQKKIVEDYLIKTDNWAYIMSLMTVENKESGTVANISTWMDEHETIFPKADVIVVSRTEKNNDGYVCHHDHILPWADVIGKYGHLIQKLDGFPNLYRAAPFSGGGIVMAEAA